jgi:hypothetical protein
MTIAANAKVESLARREPLIDWHSGVADSLAGHLIEDHQIGRLHENDVGSEILEVDGEAIPGWFDANGHVWILSQYWHRKTNQEQRCDR